jgi:hypothetical protein
MKTKKIKYIGSVKDDYGFWHKGDLVKFNPVQYEQGFKSKRVGQDWEILRKTNVDFFAKETILITKEVHEELL